ncbi:MAG: hypothetical protein Tsb002_12960 [Wenzhouxiangellaceae bacterium]
MRDGVTVKRMSELLTTGQIQAMRKEGMTQEEIMAASGYTLKTIRRVLRRPPENDTTNLLERFVGDWISDPDFPDTLPINGDVYPNFVDLCDRYRGDFKPGGLLKHLADSGLITINGDQVTVHGREVTPKSVPEKLAAVTSSIEALLGTLEHNLAGMEPPFLERRYWSHRMPHEMVPELRQRIRELTYEYRDQVIREMERAELSQPEIPALERCTVGLGVYWFEGRE